jgi:hypothetical protein
MNRAPARPPSNPSAPIQFPDLGVLLAITLGQGTPGRDAQDLKGEGLLGVTDLEDLPREDLPGRLDGFVQDEDAAGITEFLGPHAGLGGPQEFQVKVDPQGNTHRGDVKKDKTILWKNHSNR